MVQQHGFGFNMLVFAKTSNQGSGVCREFCQGYRPLKEGPAGPLLWGKGSVYVVCNPVLMCQRSASKEPTLGYSGCIDGQIPNPQTKPDLKLK